MAIEGTLTGWFELTEASRFGDRVQTIYAALADLALEFPDLEQGVLTSTEPEAGGILLRYDFTWWEVPPVDFERLFANLVPILNGTEYLKFEAKLRFGDRASTLWTIVVNNSGVFSAASDVHEKLDQQTKLARDAANMPRIEELEAQRLDLETPEPQSTEDDILI